MYLPPQGLSVGRPALHATGIHSQLNSVQRVTNIAEDVLGYGLGLGCLYYVVIRVRVCANGTVSVQYNVAINVNEPHDSRMTMWLCVILRVTFECCTRLTLFLRFLFFLFSWIQSHLDTCKYNTVPCPNNCHAQLSRICLDDHVTYTCLRRKVVCDSCGLEFTGESMEVSMSS